MEEAVKGKKVDDCRRNGVSEWVEEYGGGADEEAEEAGKSKRVDGSGSNGVHG